MRPWMLALMFAVVAPGVGHARDLTICLDAQGHRHPSVCTRGTEVGDDYVCSCPEGLHAVKARACEAGETPPAASDATDAALAKAYQSGTLGGVTPKGSRLCVAPRHQPRG
jgi:hypothetical protein